MKKLTVLFVLLLSMSFIEISAQTQTIRWSINPGTSLKIEVEGVTMVDSYLSSSYSSGPTSGVLTVNVGDAIEVFGGSNAGVLYPIITEDDQWMLEMYSIVEGDDYWFGNGNTNIFESFSMYPVDMYVEMKLW